MVQYHILNVKLSNLQLNELTSGIKNGNGVTLKLSSNVTGDSNDETNFQHKLLLTNIKLCKTQLHQIGQSGGFLVRLLGPLLKSGLPLMKNVLKLLAKCV